MPVTDAGTPVDAERVTVIAVTAVARTGTLPDGEITRVPGDGVGFTVPCAKFACVEAPTFSRQKSKLTLPGSVIADQDKAIVLLAVL